MLIDTICTKCGATVTIDFDGMSKEKAIEQCQKLDGMSRECPGFHVEFGGWWQYWQLESAIHRAYDLGEGRESNPIPSDKEYVERLLAENRVIYDGGQNTVPELNLPGIHQIAHLEHLGFGYFRSATHIYVRRDSPRGTRFYEETPSV